MNRLEEWLLRGGGNYLDAIEVHGKEFRVYLEYMGPRKAKYVSRCGPTLEAAINAALDAAEGKGK